MRRLAGLVCALAAACGPSAGRRPAAGPARAVSESAPAQIERARTPVEVRALALPAPPDFAPAPEVVSFVPAVTVVGGEDQDLDEQIELRGRLIEGGVAGVDRVEQWAVLGDLFTRKGDHQRAADSYERATRLAAFSSYSRADEVLFRREEALRALGDLSGARKALFELIKSFPSSPWVADGYLAFGDYFEAAGEGDKARAFYEKAVQIGQSRTTAYAHYKLGWLRYRAGDYQRALEQFFQAVRSSLSTDVQQRIRAAAQRGFVYAYVEVGLPRRAFPALRRMSPDDAIALAALLGDVYAARGDAANAIEVYRMLATDAHAEANACEWQARIVVAISASGTEQELRAEARRLGELALRRTACGELPRRVLGSLARRWLARAPKEVDVAIELADRYVRGFADADDAGEVAYYLADRSWAAAAAESEPARAVRRWRRVADRFDQSVRLGGLEPAQIADAQAAAALARRNASVAAAGR